MRLEELRLDRLRIIRDRIRADEELEAELKRAQGFLLGVQKKLSNERFIAGAPEKVVELERKKEADALAKIDTINASIEALK